MWGLSREEGLSSGLRDNSVVVRGVGWAGWIGGNPDLKLAVAGGGYEDCLLLGGALGTTGTLWL